MQPKIYIGEGKLKAAVTWIVYCPKQSVERRKTNYRLSKFQYLISHNRSCPVMMRWRSNLDSQAGSST